MSGRVRERERLKTIPSGRKTFSKSEDLFSKRKRKTRKRRQT